MNSTLETLRYADIRGPRFNPRLTIDEQQIADLAESIKEHGLQQPFKVRPIGDGWEVVWGQRRWRACGIAGLEEVTAWVEELTDKEAFELAIVENDQREDVHPIEEGAGYQRWLDEGFGSVHELASRLEKSESSIRERLRLARLGPEARRIILNDKRLTTVHAIEVARIPNHDRQVEALRRILGKSAPAVDAGEDDAGEDDAGEVMTIREMKDMLRSDFQRDLRLATWPLDNAQLDEKAGPCTTCEKAVNRTGANVCTDTRCFDSKAEAYWELRKQQAPKQNIKVVSDKEAAMMFPWGAHFLRSEEYRVRESKVAYDKEKGPVELAEALPQLPRVRAIVREPSTKAVFDLYSVHDIVQALRKHDPDVRLYHDLPDEQREAARKQDEKKDKKRRDNEAKDRDSKRETLVRTFERLAARMVLPRYHALLWRLVISALTEAEPVREALWRRDPGHTLDKLLDRTNLHFNDDDYDGAETIWPWIDQLPADELPEIAGQLALLVSLERSFWGGKDDPLMLAAFAERFELDMKTLDEPAEPVVRDVVAQHEKERAQRKGKAGPVEAWKAAGYAKEIAGPLFEASGAESDVNQVVESWKANKKKVATWIDVHKPDGTIIRWTRSAKKGASTWIATNVLVGLDKGDIPPPAPAKAAKPTPKKAAAAKRGKKR